MIVSVRMVTGSPVKHGGKKSVTRVLSPYSHPLSYKKGDARIWLESWQEHSGEEGVEFPPGGTGVVAQASGAPG